FVRAPSSSLLYPLSLHDALPIFLPTGPLELLARWYGSNVVSFSESASWEPIFNYLEEHLNLFWLGEDTDEASGLPHLVAVAAARSEEHTSELQSRENLVCRLLLE